MKNTPKEVIETPEKCTLEEFCKKNGFSEIELNRLIRQKKVSAIRAGTNVLVSPSVIIAELKKCGIIPEEDE